MQKASDLLPSTIEEATKGTPVAVLLHVVDRRNIEAFVAIELTKLASMINVDERLNLQQHQIPIIAAHLVETYKNESLADFKICFERGAMGRYDEKLLRLDAAVIGNWMTKYLEEKYEVLVNQLNAEKEKPYEVYRGAKSEIMLKLMREALGDYVDPDKPNNAKDNAYQRYKLDSGIEERMAFQKIIDRTAGEYYHAMAQKAPVQEYRTDDNKYYVLAVDMESAEAIFKTAEDEFEKSRRV